MPPLSRIQFNLDRIASALFEKPIRERLLRSYAIAAEPATPTELCEAIWKAFGQTSQPAATRAIPGTQQVFRAAARSLASNSRNWSTFIKHEQRFEEILAQGPRAIAAGDQAEFERALLACMPGTTSGKDTRAILAWAQRLAEHPNWGHELDALRLELRARAGDLACDELDLPLVALEIGNPKSEMKAPGMGAVLATEFLRNLHWPGYKPDRHVIRLVRRWAPDVVAAQQPKVDALTKVLGRRSKDVRAFLEVSLAALELTPPNTDPSQVDNLVWALGAMVEKLGMESSTRYLTSPCIESIPHIPDYSRLIPSPQEEVVWTSCLALGLAESPIDHPLWMAFCSAFKPPLPAPAEQPTIEVERLMAIDGIDGRADLVLEYTDISGVARFVAIEAKVRARNEHGDQLERYEAWLARESTERHAAGVETHLATLTLSEPNETSALARLETRAHQPDSSPITVHQGRWGDLLNDAGPSHPLPLSILYLRNQRKRRMTTTDDFNRILSDSPGHYPMMMEAVYQLACSIQPDSVQPRYWSGSRNSGADGAEWNPQNSCYEYGIYWYQTPNHCIGLRLSYPISGTGAEPGHLDLVHYTKSSGDQGHTILSVPLQTFVPFEKTESLFASRVSELVGT